MFLSQGTAHALSRANCFSPFLNTALLDALTQQGLPGPPPSVRLRQGCPHAQEEGGWCWRLGAAPLSPAWLQNSSMEAATSSTTGPKHLHCLMVMKGKRQWRDSLEAAAAQCLSLRMMCTAAAYPHWVAIRGASTNFMLGTAWVLHQRQPFSLPTPGPCGTPPHELDSSLLPASHPQQPWCLAAWLPGAEAGQNGHLPPAWLSCPVQCQRSSRRL